MISKLFEFLASEGNCECCGSSCKTALCSSCQKDLVNIIDEQSNSGKTSKESKVKSTKIQPTA